MKINNQKEQLAQWISKEITSRAYSQKELEAIILLLKENKKEEAWKILLKDHKCPASCFCIKDEKSQFIIKELQSNKNKEEKAEKIVNFCLDYLNQDIKEDWKKKKNKSLLLLNLAENEWKSAKKEAFKSYINKEVIGKMPF